MSRSFGILGFALLLSLSSTGASGEYPTFGNSVDINSISAYCEKNRGSLTQDQCVDKYTLRLSGGSATDDCSSIRAAYDNANRDFRDSCGKAGLTSCKDDGSWDSCAADVLDTNTNGLLDMARPLMTATGNTAMTPLLDYKSSFNPDCPNMSYSDWKEERQRSMDKLDDITQKLQQTQDQFTQQKQDYEQKGISAQETSEKVRHDAEQLAITLPGQLRDLGIQGANAINAARIKMNELRGQLSEADAKITARERQRYQQVLAKQNECESVYTDLKLKITAKPTTGGANAQAAQKKIITATLAAKVKRCFEESKIIEKQADDDTKIIESQKATIQSSIDAQDQIITQLQESIPAQIQEKNNLGDLEKQRLKEAFKSSMAQLDSIKEAQKAGEESMKNQLNTLTSQARRYDNAIQLLGTHPNVGSTASKVEAYNSKDSYDDAKAELTQCCQGSATPSCRGFGGTAGAAGAGANQ